MTKNYVIHREIPGLRDWLRRRIGLLPLCAVSQEQDAAVHIKARGRSGKTQCGLEDARPISRGANGPTCKVCIAGLGPPEDLLRDPL